MRLDFVGTNMTITHASPAESNGIHRTNVQTVVPKAVTAEARFYAVKELARRAGVALETLRTWRVVVNNDATTVYVEPGTQKRVRFPNSLPSIWTDLLAGSFRTARFDWMREPSAELKEAIPQFVAPFLQDLPGDTRPLFETAGMNCVDCNADLLLSTLLTLSRWEEPLIKERDRHGRVPATASLAYREGFLMRPIVDEYGFALQQALEHLLPGWKPLERPLRVNISHDVDNIGVPFNLRTSMGHALRRGRPAATLRDFVGVFPGFAPTYLAAIKEMTLLDLRHGLVPAVYWKGSLRESIRQTYNPHHPKVRSMIRWLQENEVETGVHPGYDTFRSPEMLRRDVQTVRQLLGAKLIGGRQDFLRWCPDTWQDWENCGLAYDSTVGYADHIGFRAGTSLPYRPWLFKLNREAKLVEIPLIIMDGTLCAYMKLEGSEALAKVRECVSRCRLVGGVFSLLWHNDTLLKPGFSRIYPEILKHLEGHPKYDCAAPPRDFY